MKTYQVVPTQNMSTTDVVNKEMERFDNNISEPRAERVDSAYNSTPEVNVQTKIYRRRWFMLAVFVLVSMMSAFQWIQFAIINDVITKYYSVSSQDVNWTSMLYMITYIPLIFPGAWIMDRWGLRTTLILGSVGTALGSWIKVCSVGRDLFPVTLFGQTVVAMSQVFVLGVPPNVAAVWFGADQVSSACSIGVFGNQLGIALGFLLPPVMVKYHEDPAETAAELSFLYYMVAGICSALAIIVIVAFQAAPPLPPTLARIASATAESSASSHYRSIKRIMANKGYVLLLVSYGLNAGVFYAMSTLLNQTVLIHFPGQQENAGRIGLVIVLCGMVGSVVCGVVLDRTHRFKETTLVVYLLAVLGMAAYTFTFTVGEIWVTFVTAGLVGFFMTGYLPVGFEFAAELTYPEPEVTSSGLLNASAQFFGIIFVLAADWLLGAYGDLVSNTMLGLALIVGAGLTVIIRSDLRRQSATKSTTVPALA